MKRHLAAQQFIKVAFIVFGISILLYSATIAIRFRRQFFYSDQSQAQTSPCSNTSGLLNIRSYGGFTFSVSCFATGLQLYDAEQRFSVHQIPDSLGAIPFVKTPNVFLKNEENLSWGITLNRPSRVYILTRRLPNVEPTLPAWATGYQRITPDEMTDLSQFFLRRRSDNKYGVYDIWQSNSSTITGQVNFGPASDDIIGENAYSMYIVAVRPQTSNPTAAPTSAPTAPPVTAPPNPTSPPTQAPNPTAAPTAVPGGQNLTTSGVIYNSDSSANISRSRSTSVRVPQNLINPTQGWIAGRIRMGFASSVTNLTPDPVIFDMSETDPRDHFIYYDFGSHTFHFARNNNAGGNTVESGNAAFSAGAEKTVVVAWTSSEIKISIDGSTFTSKANSSIPAQSAFYIGSSAVQGSGRQPNSDYYWVAAGTGVLSNADAQLIHGFGNTDRTRTSFPGSATFMWDAISNQYNK